MRILKFWVEHNGSNLFAVKLNQWFEDAAHSISHHPEIGQPTEIEGLRMKRVGHYQLYYEMAANQIEILVIWDERRDPDLIQKQIRRLKGR